MKNFFKNKKFKYGSLGVGYTIAVIALLVAINIIVSNLVFGLGWYFDMTGEKVYELSDETKSALDAIDSEYDDITIYFLDDADQMNMVATSVNYSTQSTMWGMKYVHSLALELADRYDFIKVDYIDITREPDKLRSIVGDEYYEGTKFKPYHIIIDNYTVEREADGTIVNGTDGKPLYRHDYRVYNRSSFFAYEQSSGQFYVNAFKGDYRFCSAILSVCENTIPTAYFVSGHGENIGSYTIGKQDSDYNYAQQLWQLFRDSGFNVKKIDLQHEDFGNEANAVVVIYSPSTDYSNNPNVSTNNELGKISAFLEKDNHSLMVFHDYDAQSLPNLEGYMKDKFGVQYESAQIKDSGENSIDVNRLQIVGKLQEDKSLAGYTVCAPILADKDYGKTVFLAARPIVITDPAKSSSVVDAPSSSSAHYIDKTVSYSDVTPASLATISDLGHGSYVFCTGTAYVADVMFTDAAVYENRDLILSVIDMMSKEETPINIEYKIIASEGLDITKGQATTAMLIISAGIPLVVAVIGLLVYMRRKHS